MKIPHKVRITGKISYLVVWVDRFDDSTCLGLCDSDHKTIYLHRGLSPRRAREIFWHEVLHAIEFEMKVPVPHAIIEMYEVALPRLLNLNPAIGRRSPRVKGAPK